MFVNLGFTSADNYVLSETFLILLALCRNILFMFYYQKITSRRYCVRY